MVTSKDWRMDPTARKPESYESVTPSASGTTDTARGPVIYSLVIERFRGIKLLSWHPCGGVNLILGGGDVGKTTLLDAIALLLSPTNAGNLSDTDFYARNIEAGLAIEATISLPPDCGINHQYKQYWPWVWNGTEAVVPRTEAESEVKGEPVYRLRVRGTEDLELLYEIIQPDGTADHMPVALRKAIGLVRIGGDDRNDRDLRLVQGSALDRLLSDKQLRSRMAVRLAEHEVKEGLTAEARDALASLDTSFAEQSLPTGLDLSITGGQGASIASMVGLTAKCGGVALPLANWGAGTRRLSALAIAEHNQGESPITVVDEIERGLEPYRQRALMQKLQGRQTQAFITTHSPFTISASSEAALWYVDQTGHIGRLQGQRLDRLRASDPGVFLSRLAVIAEGATEVGFVAGLLKRALNAPLEQHGIQVCSAEGNDNTLGVLEALSGAKMLVGGFADDEGRNPTRWQRVADALGNLLFRWASGCIETNFITATPEGQLEELLMDPKDENTGTRLRTLAKRLGIKEKDFESIKTKAGAELRAVITAAATGKVPTDKASEKKMYESHAKMWFKTEAGGQELADKVFSMGLWPTFKPVLLPFCCAVREAVRLPAITDIAP